MVFDGREIIGKLRVQGPTHDSPALRLRLSSFLGNASLRPPGMPPSAILVVKKLTQLWPQGLAWEDARLQPPPAWNKTLRSSMSDAWTLAARPTMGRAPMDAEAVCFSNEGEMLACLSLDLISGAVPGNWIWEQVIRSLPYPTRNRMAALWSARVGHLPALISHLYAWRQLETALSSLSRSEALDLVSDMARHHGLSFNPRAGESESVFSNEAGAGFSDLKDTGADSPVENFSRSISLWKSLPPGFADATGRLPSHALLGRLGWMIQNRPGQARSRNFSQAVSEWWGIQSAAQTGLGPEAGEIRSRTRESFPFPGTNQESGPGFWNHLGNISVTDGSAAFLGGDPAKVTDTFLSTPDDSIIPVVGNPVPADNEIQRPEPEWNSGKNLPGTSLETDIGTASDPSEVSSPAAFPISPQPVSDSIIKSPRSHSLLAPPIDDGSFSDPQLESEETDFPSQASLEPSEPGLSEGIQTRLAGVFYLVNLLMEWQWMDGLRAAGLGDVLGAWDWIELWARALLDDTAAADPGDPIWSVLAALAGREAGVLPCISDSPHAIFPAPVPAATATATPKASTSIHDRVPRPRESPPSSLENSAVCFQGPLTISLTETSRGHLEKILPDLRLGISALLGDDGNPDVTVADMLLRSGILHVNATHVDVMMRLADILMPLRRTGLDRNPGWAADFGRVIYFHFD